MGLLFECHTFYMSLEPGVIFGVKGYQIPVPSQQGFLLAVPKLPWNKN